MTATAFTGFQSVLVPLDGSPLAERALPCAAAVASQAAAVTLLAVVDSTAPLASQYSAGPPLDPGDAERLRGEMQDVRRRASRYLEAAARRLSRDDLRVKPVVGEGDPADRIVAAARETGALVVMSTHGRSGLVRALVGSVAERVVREAPGPVLVVR